LQEQIRALANRLDGLVLQLGMSGKD